MLVPISAATSCAAAQPLTTHGALLNVCCMCARALLLVHGHMTLVPHLLSAGPMNTCGPAWWPPLSTRMALLPLLYRFSHACGWVGVCGGGVQQGRKCSRAEQIPGSGRWGAVMVQTRHSRAWDSEGSALTGGHPTITCQPHLPGILCCCCSATACHCCLTTPVLCSCTTSLKKGKATGWAGDVERSSPHYAPA
jgi:hypothetical protein